MKDDSYREQNGCHNCEYVFDLLVYEQNDVFYCTKNDTQERPKCGSEYLNEEYDPAFYSWSEERKVKAFGVCHFWSEKHE